MAAQDIPRGVVEDFLGIGVGTQIEGPNLSGSKDGEGKATTPGGVFLQSDVPNRVVSGGQKGYFDDDAVVLPEAGEAWDRTGAAGTGPDTIRVNTAAVEGQADKAYKTYNVGFEFEEEVTNKTITAADYGIGVVV